MANYTPFTLSNMEQRPYGPVAGFDAGIQDLLTKQAQRLDLESMATANQQSQANLARYLGETPNKLAQSNLDGSIARATDPRIMTTGKHGEARQQAAAGDKLTQMLESDVAAGKAKNAAEAATNRHKQFTQELQVMHEFLPFMDTPMAQGAWSQTRSRLPQEYQQAMPERYDPRMAPIIKKILVETPKHLQELAQIAAQTQGNIDVANINRRSQEKIAGMQTGTQLQVAQLQANSGNETKRVASLRKAIGAGKDKEGELEEYGQYLVKEIDNNAEVKEMARMLMMDLLEKKGANAGRISDSIRKKKSLLWDDKTNGPQFGRLRGMNPFKGATEPVVDPKAAKNDPRGIEIMPGVWQKR